MGGRSRGWRGWIKVGGGNVCNGEVRNRRATLKKARLCFDRCPVCTVLSMANIYSV